MSGGTRIPDSRNGNPGLNPGGSFRTGKSGQIQSPDGSAIQKSAKESGGKLAAGAGISPKAAIIYQKSGPGVSQSSLQNPAFQKIPENSGSAEHTVPIREFFKQSAANLGFPKDILSVTLFAASRFFSLSPGAALLGELRRELLSSLKSSSPKNAAEKAALGAQSLAAAAARDKGVIPGPEALEHYARFFAFPVSDGEGGTGAEGAGNGGKGGGENPSEQAAADAGPGRRDSSREDVPDAGELRAIAEEEAGKDGLLNFFNTLPGKNGQRWIVYPFKINVRGIELSVIIRILKKVPLCSGSGKGPGKVPTGISEEDGRVIADIAGPKRQWRFFLDKKAGKLRADIRVYPEMSSKALDSLKKEAESFFGKGRGAAFGGFEEIRAQNGGDNLSWAEDLCGEPLPSVNKEV